MNEAVEKALKVGQKIFELSGFSPKKVKEARILVARDIKREVMQEFEVFY